MRVLLLPASYPPILGGLQTVARTLARHFIRQGHQLQVVTQRYPHSLPGQEVLEGVPVQRRLFLTPSRQQLSHKRVDLFLSSLYYYPATLLYLNQLTSTFPPDVVNVHFPDAQIPFVLWLRRRYKFRLVVSIHGDEIERWSDTSPDSRLSALRRLLQSADAVTACSGYLLGRAAELEPAVAAKGQVIHNGIDPTRFEDQAAYPHPRPYLLAYGRLTHTKGFDLLLEAFAQIAPFQPELDLLLAGVGEAEAGLKAQAKRLNLAGRVHFLGRVTPAEVVRLLNGCRLVVAPSRRESFGIVSLEAMAAGKPLLATRVGGLREFIPRLVEQACPPLAEDTLRKNSFASPVESETSSSVFMVEPTVADLTLGLQRLLNRETCPDQAETIRRYVLSHYSWDQVVRQYESVLAG